MFRTSYATIVRSLCVLLVVGLSVIKGYSQAGNATINATDPRHETPSQQIVSVLFDQPISSATSAGWTVFINGLPATTLGAIATGSRVLVQFDASTVPGHAAAKYILPADVVRISYDPITGNTLTGTAGTPEINAIILAQSKNNYLPNCTDTDLLAKNFYSTEDKCAPVVMDFWQWVYEVSMVYRNSSRFPINKVFFQMQWGDPANTATNTNPYNSDNAGGTTPTFGSAGIKLTTQPVAYITVRPTFTYPATYTLPAPTSCEFTARLTPFLAGIGSCAAKVDQTLMVSWDTDNKNTGTLNLPPLIVNTDKICLGTNVGMKFSDATTLNCQAAVEINVPNDQQRWIRITYGSTNAGGPGNIPDIRVVPPAAWAALGLTTKIITNNDATGTFITPNFFFTGPGGVGLPDANGVVQLPTVAATAATYMGNVITTLVNNQAVGQRFFVKLEYWDFCNKYDQFNPATLLIAESVENFDIIIPKPVPAVPIAKNFCQSESMTTTPGGPTPPGTCVTCFEVTAASVTSNTEIRWYTTLAQANADTPLTNDYGIQSRFLRPSQTVTIASGGTGPIPTAGPATGDTYSAWIRYRTGVAPNNCLSDPVEVKIVKRESLTTPTITSTASFPICSGTNGVPFTAAPVPATNPLGGAWNYTWGTTGGDLTINPATTSQNMTLDIALIASGAHTATALRKYTTTTTDGKDCASPVQSFPFTVDRAPVGGTITGGTTPACLGASYTLTLNGSVGNVVRWEVQRNALGFNPVANTTTSLTDSPTLPGTYTYQAIVGNGVCANVTSGTRVIVINARPTASVLSATPIVICSPGSSNLQVAITGGASPYSVVYFDGVANATVNGYVSGNNIPVSPTATTTYSLVSVTDANGCTSLGLSGTPTVTVSNPTSAVLSGSQNVCPSPFPGTNFKVDIVGGVGPFTIRYTINGGPPVTKLNYNTGDPIATGPLTVNTTYALVDARDAGGCIALSNTGTAVMTVGSSPASAVFAGGGPVCAGTPRNLTLTITGGVAPYTIQVTNNSGTPVTHPTINNASYTSGANIPVNTSIVVTVDYTVTLVTDACGTALPVALISGRPQTVTVNPVPSANPTTTVATICSGIAPNIPIGTTSAVTPASSYTWTAVYDAGLTGGAAASAGSVSNIQPGALTNAGTNIVRNATFTVTPTATTGGCPGPTFVIVQPVNVQPVGGNKITAAVCSNVGFSFNPQTVSINAAGGNSVPSTFTWTRSLAGGLTLVTPGAGTGNIAETIENLTGAVANVTYTIIPTATTGSCAGSSFTIQVPINPQPVGNSRTAPAVCSASPMSVNIFTTSVATGAPSNGNGVTSSYTWTAAYDGGSGQLTGGAGTGSATSASPLLTETLINVTAIARNAVYTITPTATTGSCVGATFQITVPINPRAVVTTPLPATTVSCAGDVVTLTIVATGPGITYKWQENSIDVNDGGIYSGTTTNVLTLTGVTATQSGKSYRVTMTTTGPCSVNSNASVLTVNPLPLPINITPNPCSTVPGGNQVVQNLTLFNGTVTSTGGTTVTWFQNYNAGTKTFSNPILPGSTPGQDQAYTVTNGDVVWARIRITATGCINAASATFTVKPRPNDNLIKDGTGATISTVATSPAGLNICASGSSILFQTDATINPSSTFAWTVPVTSYANEFTQVTASANIIVLKFPNPTEGNAASLYKVTGIPITVVETLNGCQGNPVTINVHVLSAPAPSVITGDGQVCENGIAHYSVPNTSGSSYAWTLPPGATITSLPVTSSNITVQMSSFSGAVTVTESNGTCLSPAAAPFPVTVISRPVLGTIVNPVCSGFNVNTAVTLSSNIPGSKFNWEVLSIAGSFTGSNAGDFANGVLDINQTPVNVSGIAGSITYRVTPVGPAPLFCTGSPQTFAVTVNPEPVLDLAPKPLCSGEAAQYQIKLNPSLLPSNTLLSWPAPVMSDASVQGTSSGGSVPIGNATTIHINTAFVNNSGAPITATYTITANAGGCVSGQPLADRQIVLTINPSPVGAPATRTGNCSNVPFSVSADNITNGVPSTFTWVRNALPPGLTQVAPGTGSGTIDETLKNLTSAMLSATYVVTPKSIGNCVGATYVITVQVNPEPVGANIIRAAQCSGVAFSVSANNVTNGVAGPTFAWVRNALPIGLNQVTAGTGIGAIAETLQNITGGQLSATYVVTPTSGAGCDGNTYVVTVPINPEPVGSNITRPAQCSNAAFSVSADNISNGLGATSTYTWTRDPLPLGLTQVTPGTGVGAIAEKLQNITSGQLSAVYTVTPKSSANCVGATYKITVPVNPEPVGSPSTKANQCSNVAFTFNPQTDITNSVTSTFAWSAVYDAGSGQLTGGANSGTGSITETLVNLTSTTKNAVYTIVPTSSVGTCAGASFVMTVPVQPQPVGAPSTKAPVCSNVPFSFNPQSDITNSVVTTFTWVAVYDGGSGQVTGGAGTGTGTIAETLVNLSGSTRNAAYTVTPHSTTGNCLGNTFVITVPIQSQPVGASATKLAQCSNVPFSFNPQADITNGVGSTFAWTAVYDGGSGLLTGGTTTGTGLIAETLVNLTGVVKNAVYTVTPTSVTGTCAGSTYVITVPINSQPVGAAATKASQCSAVAFSFNPQVDITNGVTSTFTWTATYDAGSGLLTGGAGSGSGNIAETLNNVTGTTKNAIYTVTPTATTGGCVGATYLITVPVNPQPVGAASTKAFQCSDVAFSFNPQADITNGVASTFTWTAVYDGGSGQLTGGATTGTGAVAETLTNVSGSTRNAVYTITPKSTTGVCLGATFVITVPVRSKPVGAASTKAAQCSGVAFSFNPQADITNGVTSTFAWTAVYDAGSGNLVGGAGTGTGLIAETLTNLTGGSLNAVYTVTPKSVTGTCTGVAYVITIPVTSQPVGAPSTKAAQCSHVAFSFNPQNDITNGVASTFTWTAAYDGGSGQLTGGASSGSGLIAETLTNLSGTQKNAVYTVTPSSSSGACTGATFVITVPVNPEPVGANIARAAQCSNVAFSLSANNITNGLGATSTYAWSRNTLPPGLTEVVGGGGTGNINETLENLTSGTINATYVVTPTSAAGCVGATYVITVPVNPQPVGSPVTRPNQCSNVGFSVSAINITNGLTTGTTYTWVRNTLPTGLTQVTAGVSGATIAEKLQNLTNAQLSAVYVVTPKSSNNCVGATYTITVPVNPEPVGTAPAPIPQCSNVAFSVNPDNVSNLTSGNTFTWVRNPLPAGLTQVIAGTGSGMIAETLQNITGTPKSATYVVTPKSADNCTGATYVVTIPVNPEPVGAPSTAAVRCSGDAISFDLNTIITNSVTSNFKYTVVADFPLDLAPAVFPGTFDRTTASAAFISETFSNYSSHDVVLTYTVTPISSAGTCTGNPFVLKVTYHPEPVGANFTEPNCNTSLNHSIQTQIPSGLPSIFTYVVTSSNEAAVPTPVALDRTVASDNFITDSYVNLSGTPVTITYTITAFNKAFPGCAGAATFTYNVTIAPKPVGVTDVKAAQCSDVAFSVDPQNNIVPAVASTFTWTATYDGSPIPSGTGVINANFNNVTALPKDAVYTITPTAQGTGCVGLPFTITIPINPEPVMDPALANPAPICSTNAISSNPTNIVLNTNGASIQASTFTVTLKSKDVGLTGTPTVGTFPATAGASNAIQNDKFGNTTSAQLKVVYTIVPKSAAGCFGDAFDITVLVNPEPVLASSGFPDVCSTNAPANISSVNVVLGTNGTSANVAPTGYQLTNRQYSNGGPFSTTLPTGFSLAGNNTTVGNTGGINLVKNEKFNNVSGVPVTVRYTIQGTSAQGCKSLALDYDVIVKPEPVLDPALSPTPVCSGVISNVTLGTAPGSVGAVSYNITSISFTPVTGFAPSVFNTGVGNGKTATAIKNDTYINTVSPPTPIQVTYKISPVSADGCVGIEGTVVLTINPSPEIDDNLNKIVCSGAISNITLASKPGTQLAATYNVVSITPQAGLVAGGTNVAAANGVGATYILNDKFTNPTNNPLTVTYRIEGISTAPCTGPFKDVVLTVEPAIVAVATNNKPSICSGSGNTTDLTNIVLTSPSVPTAGGITFNYSAALTGGTGTSGFTTITLSNLPQGAQITDNLVNTSNAVATVTYTITAVANGAAGGGAGCSSSPPVTVPVIVEPRPKLIASPLVRTICEGPLTKTNIALSSLTVPSTGTIEYLLVSAVATGGVTGMSPVNTVFAKTSTLNDALDNPGASPETVTYTLRPRMTAGALCIGDDVIVTITVNPRPDVTATPPAPICSGDQIDIPLTAVPAVAQTVFTWTVSATANITGATNGAGDNIVQSLFNKGTVIETVTYTVTAQSSGCAGTPFPISVNVNPKPSVVGVPATVKVCHGNTLTVPLASTIDPLAVNYTWTVSSNAIGVPLTGSGSTISQPMTNTQGFQENLTYEIVPFGPGGCEGVHKIMIVTVSPQTTASFLNSPQPDYLCKGSTEYLIFSFGGQAPFDFTYTKTIVKNGIPQTPTAVAVLGKGNVAVIQDVPGDTTIYTITSVKDGLGCVTPFSVPFTVNVGDTDPNFTIISPVETCSPNQVSFQYHQVAGTIYTWRFGDVGDSTYTATTSVANKVIKHTYTNLSPTSTLKYPVTMQTELPAPYPGCFKTTPPKTITIRPNIIANVISDKSEICSGETVQFSNQSVGATSQTWTYRVQGQTAELPMGTSVNIAFVFNNNTASNPINYEIIYRATNGFCPTPDQITPLKVYRSVVAGFNEGTVPPFISGSSTVNFTNTSTPIDPTAFNYEWSFGSDAVPATFSGPTPPAIKYVRPGPKTVVLTATNNQRTFCTSTFTKTINIVLLPLVATFTASPIESCFPSKITITQSNITGDEIDWRVIDSNGRVVATSTGGNPVFSIPSPGKFTITLKTSSSLTGQFAVATPQDITIYPKPFASFVARPDVVFVPDTPLTTTNFSTGANQYLWDFDFNGDTSPLEEPTYTYKVEGVYNLALYAQFDHGGGLVCADTLIQKITAKQGGVTKIPNAFTPNLDGPGHQPGPGDAANDVFMPIVRGAEEYNLQIYDRWGNLIFESNSTLVGWDGYNKDGRLLQAGVYVYKLTIRLSDGQRTTQIGDVTMIR